MKSALKLLTLSLLVLATAFSIQSCESDPTSGQVFLNFQPVVNGTNLNLGETYTVNGVNVRFSKVQFYLSDISMRFSGSEEVFNYNNYLLVHTGQQSYDLGQVRIGDATSLQFNIGVDSMANHADPSAYPSDHPLSSQNPNFAHWSWDAGYRFFVIEGTIDTDGDGDFETTMEYHIGGDANLATALLADLSFAVAEETQTLSINADVGKILQGIDLSTENISHVGDFPTVAATLVFNVPGAFSRN